MRPLIAFLAVVVVCVGLYIALLNTVDVPATARPLAKHIMTIELIDGTILQAKAVTLCMRAPWVCIETADGNTYYVYAANIKRPLYFNWHDLAW